MIIFAPNMTVGRGILAIALPGTVHTILGNAVEPVSVKHEPQMQQL
jgi:hypothetical protein